VPANAVNYTGCAVLVYTDGGEYIQKSDVHEFDKDSYRLKLCGGIPETLAEGDICSLLILTEPAPREYKGLVEIFDYERVLLLHRGRTKEARLTNRFKVNFPARIISLIRQDEIYELHTPVEARVVNISRSGVRISTHGNALRSNDRIQLKIQVDDSEKKLTAIVTNKIDTDENVAEYGCGLVVEKK